MKIFTSFVFFLVSYLITSGQCVPDTSITHNKPGNYPDTITGLPHSITGQSYSTVIQVKVLTDSTVGTLTGVVDSIVVENVTGLPSGFSYTCTPSSCSFPGGSDGCITLSGSAPTILMVGSYPLVVQSTIYFKIFGTPQTLQNDILGYSIVIDTTTGISTLEKNNFSAGQNSPNPAKDYTVIPLTISRPEEVSLTIVNLIGKKVFSRSYNLQKGKTNITLDLHNLQPGIYLYTFSNGLTSVARRMIITND